MTTIIQSIAFAISILIPLSIGKVLPSALQVFLVLLISFTSLYIGRLTLIELKLKEAIFSPFAFNIIIGFSILSVIELLLIHFLHLNPLQSFLIIITTLVGLSILNRRLRQSESIALSKLELKQQAFDFGVLIFISVLTTVWCRELILSVENAHSTGIFRVWPDLFLHTNEIISLENYSYLNNQSLSLSGTKKSFYHFASYALPSLYASATNELALVVATSFWTPVGIILMGLGVYLLGSTLGGRFVGIISVIAVFLLPDTSMYGLKIGYFGFHWLLQISAGSGYAMSLIFLSLSLFVVGQRESRFELVLWSLPIVMLCAFFRVQLAAPALIMMMILINIVWRPKSNWHRPAVYLLLLTATISIIIMFERIDFAPHFLSGELGASKFFDGIHSRIASKYSETGLGNAYVYFLNQVPTFLNWLVGYAIFLISALGLLFPILITCSIWILRKRVDLKINMIPLVMILAGFIIIIVLPIPPDGDYSNFGHRPFILYYATSIIFLGYWLSTFYLRVKHKNKLITSMVSLLGFTLTCLCLTVPFKYGKDIQQPKGWSDKITINPIPSGFFDASTFIREHSKPDDLVLSSDLAPWSEVVTLTERPAFISRERFYSHFNGSLKQDFLDRKKEFDAFALVKTSKEICNMANKNKIIWILKFPNDFNRWPKEVLDMYVYKSEGFFVYNFSESNCSKFIIKK